MTTQTAPLITVLGEEDPIEIGFPALAAYHGQGALAMLAVAFRAVAAALAALSPDAPLARKDVTVVSGHPGPGVRDAFEFVTRAVTRGVYVVDRSLPESRFVPGFDIAYSWRVSHAGQTVEVALRPGVLPERFFALTFNPARTPAENDEARRLRKAIAAEVLGKPAEALFSIRLLPSPAGSAD